MIPVWNAHPRSWWGCGGGLAWVGVNGQFVVPADKPGASCTVPGLIGATAGHEWVRVRAGEGPVPAVSRGVSEVSELFPGIGI